MHVENSKACFVDISTLVTIQILCQQDLSTVFEIKNRTGFVRFCETL